MTVFLTLIFRSLYVYTRKPLNARNHGVRKDLERRGQKAALVIRLFYEEERQKAKERMSLGGQGGLKEGTENFQGVNLGKETAEVLASKAGMTSRNIYFLLAVYRNRPDLFELVFDGSYSASSSSINVSNSFISSTSKALAIASNAFFG